MVKPEWGAKRICHACGAAFYDMRRDTIVCPKCGAAYDPEAVLKSRRSRPMPVEDRVAPVAAVVADDVEVEVEALPETEDLEVEEEVVDDADAEEDEVLEDASELGEDEDDMAEVIEHIEEDE